VRRHDDAGEREAAEHERLQRRIDLGGDHRVRGGDLDAESLRDQSLRRGRGEKAARRLLPQPVDVERPALPPAPGRGQPGPSADLRAALEEHDAVPRSAAPRAASSPATPPPTTTTRCAVSAGTSSASAGSRMPGLTAHHIGRAV
jgi:hypothetical protein